MLLRRHYSSAELLAYFDGETPRRARAHYERHLQRCWSCRSKLLALEQQIQIATDIYGGPEGPESPSEADQKQRFRDAMARFEGQFSARTHEPAGGRRWLPLAIAAAVLAVPIALNMRRQSAPPVALSPAEVLMRAAAAERVPPRRALHQTFAVSLHQSRPAVEDREARLQVWSDPVASRFCSRFEDKEGHLRLGVWRNSSRTYGYRAGRTGHAAVTTEWASSRQPAPVIADMASKLDGLEGFESAFLDWLESRDWQPILLGSETALLRTTQGEWVQARRSASADAGVVTLVISKELDSVKMTVSLEFDTRTYRARLQRLQMTTARSSAEIRLTVLQREFLDAAQVPDAIFRPDNGLLPRNTVPVIAPALPSAEARTIPEPPSEGMDDRETDVLYALHRLHADLGEPVTVRQHAGRIRVEALLNSAERKHEITAALLGSYAGSVLDLDIRTIDELAASAAAADGSATPLSSQRSDDVNQNAASPSQTALRLDLQKLLRGQESGEGFVEMGNIAVRVSSKALEDAWALRRLGERYPDDRLAVLQPHSRSQLESMARDLTQTLQDDSAELRRLLQPSLRAFGGGVSPPAGSGMNKATAMSDMFQAVLRMRDMVHFAFAGRRLERNDEERFIAAPAFAREMFVRCDGLQDKIQLAGDEMVQRVSSSRFATDTR